MERQTLSWRQFFTTVNFRDFWGMVRAELGLIGSSLLLAVRSLTRLPFGPLLFVAMTLMALVRLIAVLLVVAVLGTSLAVIMLVRRGLTLGVRSPRAG